MEIHHPAIGVPGFFFLETPKWEWTKMYGPDDRVAGVSNFDPYLKKQQISNHILGGYNQHYESIFN